MTRTCKYEPCSKEFEPTHWRQEFCTSTCRAAQHYLDHPEKGRSVPSPALPCVAEHPLAAARAEQEASELNDRLAQIVYNAIIDRLKSAGSCRADDLEDYFPDEHRDRCRKLVPGQLGSLRGRKFIQPTSEYRKSKVPARKCAKSWVYVFTEKGRATLVGHRAGGRGQAVDLAGSTRTRPADATPSSVSGETGAGVSESTRPEEVSTVDLESASASSPEPLQLPIAEPSKYQDHDQPRAA